MSQWAQNQVNKVNIITFIMSNVTCKNINNFINFTEHYGKARKLAMGQNTLGDHKSCTFRAFARATEHAIFSLHFLMHS